jgi:signal transduction histidine kinase
VWASLSPSRGQTKPLGPPLGLSRVSSTPSESFPQSTSKEELLTRLARGLAHEIRNPLSTMAINLTLLEEEFTRAGEDDPRSRRASKRVRTLQREVSRLEGILGDFLHYARGGMVNRQPGDLVAFVHEVLEFMEPEHRTHEIRVLSDLESGLPLVLLDGGVLRQVLINLLVNARQAMPGGGELILQVRRVGPRAHQARWDGPGPVHRTPHHLATRGHHWRGQRKRSRDEFHHHPPSGTRGDRVTGSRGKRSEPRRGAGVRHE